MVNRNGLMKRRWEQASYTVEAALCGAAWISGVDVS